MASIEDQDRYFAGQIASSTPRHIVGEGVVTRLINARFAEGAITNAIGFDEVDVTLDLSIKSANVPSANISYKTLLYQGDIQLLAPLKNVAGEFLILIVGGVILQIDTQTNIAYDITPIDSFLPPESLTHYPLSYIDNDGNLYGTGGYLVVFNYPNRPIFINQTGARISDPFAWEMPTSRLGATAGNRAFVISGNNILYASDPLGGSNATAPLTFQETLDPSGTYYQQVFTIGSSLDLEEVTNISRIPRLFGATQDFLAQSLLVSTKNRKYIIAAGAQRSTWDTIEFITYAGTSEGIAGPLASTNIGSALVYISSTGRIKTLSQDTERNESLSETYFDDELGMYACCNEDNYYFRPWYRELDHSRSVIKFNRDRLYATVYPVLHPASGRYGDRGQTTAFRALAIGSLDSTSQIGAQASISWEGFYDWLNPVSIALLENRLYIISKDKWGRNRLYKENFTKLDTHKSSIYTRGYFSGIGSKAKSLMSGTLYFRELAGKVGISISYLVNGEWICGVSCENDKNVFRFTLNTKCKTDSWSVPLRVDIDHHGCRFELESIRVNGESHKDER